LAAFRGLFRSDKGYKFQVHQNGTMTSSGAGVLAVSVPTNNTTGPTISEWAALAALFDECKLMHTQLGITTGFGPGTSAIPVACCIAFDHANSSSSAPGFGNVQRLAESRFVALQYLDGGSGRHVQSARVSRSRLFGLTAAPTSTSSDVGMNGEWYVSSQDTTTVSTKLGWFDVESVVLFRNRA
jgi:hypothetical protein